MTFPNPNRPKDRRYRRRGASGGGTVIATIIIVALIVLGTLYMTRDDGSTHKSISDRATRASK